MLGAVHRHTSYANTITEKVERPFSFSLIFHSLFLLFHTFGIIEKEVYMKKKTVMIIVSALLVLTAIAGFFFLRPTIHFTEGEKVLERGLEYKAMDLVASSNGEVTPEKETLDSETVGEFEFHYTVKKWFFSRDIALKYRVEDTTPPVITFKRMKVNKDPGEKYTEKEITDNVALNEGTFTYKTDYDPEFSGIYTVKISAVDDYGNASEASYEVIVRDIEGPLVFRSGDYSQILVGDEFNIQNYISYGDNADDEPELTVEGEVDTSVIGYYPLHAVLTDDSGNKTEWDLTIEVTDYIPEWEPSDYFYTFDELRTEYAGAGRQFGLDLSEWQGDIDFEAVRDAGCDFVILRIGWSFEGELHLDKTYRQNLERAKNAGIPVGVYLFCYDYTEEQLRASLDKVFTELGDTKLELPLVFDWENFGNYQDYYVSFQKLNHFYDVFEEEVKNHGYESMLYGSKYYLDTVWTHTDERPIWLAQYYTWPTYSGPYQIWQLTDSGRINGIDGNCDFNIMFTR